MKRKLILAAALCASAALPVAAVKQGDPIVSTFDDIQYWVGNGTNRCAVVIDFNDGSVPNSSFAWGYRWNGDAPSVESILNEIAADDPRLTAFVSGGWVSGFGYDVDDDGGTFRTGKTYTKSDEDDLFPQSRYVIDDSEYDDDDIEDPMMYMVGDDWAISKASGETFENLKWSLTAGVAAEHPTDGEWHLMRFAHYVMEMNYWSYIENDYEPTKAPLTVTRTFRLSDVQYWIGSGTNAAAIAISWGEGKTRAWGYRWNGEAPVMKQVLQEIAAADTRLVPYIKNESWGAFLYSFGYDAEDVGGITYNWTTYTASDASAWVSPYSTDCVDPEDWTTWIYHYFNFLSEPDAFFRTGTAAYGYSSVGIEEFILTSGTWTIFAYNEGAYLTTLDSSIASATPSATAEAFLPTVAGAAYSSLNAAFDAARGGGSVTLPLESSVNAETKTVTVGTVEAGTLQTYVVPAYFDMTVSGSSVTLALNAAATPTLVAPDPGDESAPKPFAVDDTKVTVVPGNVIDGLYYGLAVSTNLTEGFSAPTEWVRAANGTVVLEKAKSVTANGEFYRVRVSDIDESMKQ